MSSNQCSREVMARRVAILDLFAEAQQQAIDAFGSTHARAGRRGFKFRSHRKRITRLVSKEEYSALWRRQLEHDGAVRLAEYRRSKQEQRRAAQQNADNLRAKGWVQDKDNRWKLAGEPGAPVEYATAVSLQRVYEQR